jgi:serine/threonine protein kinase
MNKVIENYVLKEIIGSGQYGKVYRASDVKTNDIYAIKAIKNE